MNPTGRAPIDLRLVPAALAVWATTLVGLAAGSLVLAALALLSLGAVPVVWWLARRRPWFHGALAVLGTVGIAAVALGVRCGQVESHPLREAAEEGVSATVRVVLTSKPRPTGGSAGASGMPDRSTVRAELRHAELSSGRRVHGSGAVLLLVPTARWQQLIAGQAVTVTADLVPPRDPGSLVAVARTYQPPADVAAAPMWQRVAEDLRAGLRRHAATVLDPDGAGLLSGLVVGDTSTLAPETEREFETAGLTHLTAVSGANLAIVCGTVVALATVSGAGPVVAAVGAGIALVGFVVLAGPEPSVLRAAVMGAIALAALALGRQRSALPALAASVVGLLLFLPDLAVAPGFALSVAATAGLVLLAPGWSAALRYRGVPAGVAEALAVPAAAQLVTAPLLAAITGEVSVVAVLANLLVAPVIAPATVLGVLVTVLVPVSGVLADALVWLAGFELDWVLAVAQHAAAIPGAAFAWPSGIAGGVLLGVLAVVAFIVLRAPPFGWTLAVLVIIAGSILIPRQVTGGAWPPNNWSMVVCDVGEGDAIVLATGVPKEAVIVDTGPATERTADCVRRLGVRRVPMVVLTHPHADHVGGLGAILSGYPVGAVALGPVSHDSTSDKIVRSARARSVSTVELAAGQRVRWPNLVLDVLGPSGSLARSEAADDANDSSLVVRATTPAGRILLTGDIEIPGQSALLASGADLRADVLKIPHHGSRHTAARFLRAVRPRLAVASVGADNRYGHPSPQVLGLLTRAGAKVLRTDEKGDIAVFGSGTNLRTTSRGNSMTAR